MADQVTPNPADPASPPSTEDTNAPEQNGTPPTPADVAQRQSQTPAPATPAPGSDPEDEDENGSEDGDLGFPANTPVKDMTDKQQAAYWRNLAKKFQKQNKPKKEAPVSDTTGTPAQQTQTPSAPAPATPEAPAAPAASAPAAPATPDTAQRRLLNAQIRIANSEYTRETADALIDDLNVARFFTAEGEVDEEAVARIAGTGAPKVPAHNPAKDILGAGGTPAGNVPKGIQKTREERAAAMQAAKTKGRRA